MNLLVFSDLHADIRAMKSLEAKAERENPDLVICLGDVSIFEQYLDVVMKRLSKINKNFLVIHGNHESEGIMKKICSFHKNMKFVHKKIYDYGGYSFIGFGGGGFSLVDREFERFVKENEKEIKGKRIILLTHASPHNTKLDNLHGEHCGNKSITNFIKSHNVVLALSGHFHETAGQEDFIGKARLVNPGAFGKIITI